VLFSGTIYDNLNMLIRTPASASPADRSSASPCRAASQWTRHFVSAMADAGRQLWFLLLFCFVPAQQALAQGMPSFALPIDCEIGQGCVLQNYVDHDAGPGARDYRCGHLVYDGHKGTDIRVIDLAAFRRGVPVRAAAAGRVRAVRDGMEDVSVRKAGKAAIAGREAGNSVVIEHGEGWETQYAHLRKGSVLVRPGERVEAGQRLGLTGLSGNTEFPHLHFEVRQRGRTVDPFVGLDSRQACEPGRAPLWSAQASSALSYVSTGILGAGLSGAPPKLSDGSIDPGDVQALVPESIAAVFWVQVYGVQKDDVEELRLLAPDGRVLAERRVAVERNMAQSFSYVGLKRRAGTWPGGPYRGEYALYRSTDQRKVVFVVRELKL
jgi:hypothetical protein